MKDKKNINSEKLPKYEKPQVMTYSDTELLDLLGPAQAGSVDESIPGFGGGGFGGAYDPRYYGYK